MSSDMFERLMAINREAFDNQQFSVAYHLLAAALHCAQDTQNEEHMLQVVATANEQLAFIDLHHPEYKHSSQSAKTRTHESIFHLLAVQASAEGRMTRWKHQQQQEGSSC